MLLEGFTPERVWGLDVINDFFMAGGVFGAYACAAAWLLFRRERFAPVAELCMAVSFVCLCVLPFNLIDDLHQPARIWRFFTGGWGNIATAPMKWGVVLLFAYPAALALLWLALRRGGYFGARLFEPLPAKLRALAWLVLALSACLPGYTGYILGASVGVAFWNSPVLVLEFIANGALGGVGLCGLCALLIAAAGGAGGQKQRPTESPLCAAESTRPTESPIVGALGAFARLAGVFLIIDIILRFFWFSFMLSFSKEIKDLYAYAISAKFYEIFLVEGGLICLIAAVIFTRAKNCKFALLLGFLAMCAYSFAFKFNVILGGNAMPKIMAGFLDFFPRISGADSLLSVLGNWLVFAALFFAAAGFLRVGERHE